MQKLITYSLFIFFLLTGILIFKDYGVSTDEDFQRLVGFYWLNYIANFFPGSDFLLDVQNKIKLIGDLTLSVESGATFKYYGVIFDLPLAFIETVFNITDPKNFFYLRHFLNFFLFWVSSVYFYKILIIRFKNWSLAISGFLIYVLSPRIFAESFYNNKDLILLSLFSISFYYVLIFFKKENNLNSIKLGIICAVCTSSRVLGILLIITCLLIYIFDLISLFKERIKSYNKYIILVFSYSIFLIIIWPYLWENPFKNFFYTIKIFSNYLHIMQVLYNGEYYYSNNLPWHYSIVWPAITTPILYIFFFILGFFFFIKRFLSRFVKIDNSNKRYSHLWVGYGEKFDVFLFFLLIIFYFLIIKLNATLYDGWRQLYFIYPIIIYYAIYAIQIFYYYLKGKKYIINYLLTAYLTFLIYILYTMHPMQMVYFNFLAKNNVSINYQVDYWGLSSIQAIKKILNYENNKLKVRIANASYVSLWRSLVLLDENDKNRIEFVGQDYKNADYIFTNFNSEVNMRVNSKYSIPKNFQLVDSLYVNKIKVYDIYKKIK
jgi:hypothetical protein